MRQILAGIIRSFGSTVEAVKGGETARFRAFLQPVTSKSWQNMDRVIGPLGEIPRGQYLYIGPVEQDVLAADFLRCGGAAYLVRRADTLLLGDEPLYVWALLVRRGGEDPWND